jgi:hypothetical protein
MTQVELNLPNKEQIAIAVKAMRAAHFSYGYTRWPRDYYFETVFWAGFFAAYLNQQTPPPPIAA